MPDESENLLADLLLRWEEAWDLDEDIPSAALCADHPELEEKLSQQILVLKAMAWMKKDAAEEVDQQDEADTYLEKTLGGRYKIESVIGFGGYGRVYKAFDPELERHIAIKLARSMATGNTDALLEEARKAAKLRHPGIVAIHDVGREDGQIFFVSELIDGENLAELIANDRPSFQETQRIIIALADALQFAHDQGFLHRDIKPANILIDRQGRVLITDFGIATTIDKLEDHRGGTPGTLPYMAPEQIAGEVQLIGARTDIHALGVVLYELLTGELPYQGRTPTAVREQILLRQPKPLIAYGTSVPKELAAVCLKCLAKHPADRYSSASEVVDALSSPDPQSRGLIGLFAAGVILLLISLLIWQSGAFVSTDKGSAETILDEKTAEFVFDGTSRIVTPLERFVPVTLEAWVFPTATDIKCHFIFGSDIRGEFGIGLAICGGGLSAETVPQMIKSKAIVPPGKWSHVTGIFAASETRLYLDGKLVHTGPATEGVTGATAFVVGNVGEGSPIDYFEGKIRSVRITEGERYMADFSPDETFFPDNQDAEKVKLIFDGRHTDGETVSDLSGNGNDGRWESFSR